MPKPEEPTLLFSVNGYWRCPVCRQALLITSLEAKAIALPLFCRRCKTTLTVNIKNGLCWTTEEFDTTPKTTK